MPRFVVVSYDDDQQQAFWDLVEAEDIDSAMAIIDEVRDYVHTVDAMTVTDMQHTIGQMESAARVAKTAQEVRRHLKFDCGSTDYDDYFCRECGEDYDGAGDGYDGLCPSCADRAEKAGVWDGKSAGGGTFERGE